MDKFMFDLQIFANESGGATVWNCPNYVGELFLIGANQTPFLNMIGGLSGGRRVSSWEFPLGQTYALNDAAQQAITETASLTAPTADTFVRSQDVNTCQIIQKQVSASYAKLSNIGTVGGLSILGDQPITNELDFQKAVMLKQIAKDLEYTFLRGVYQKATAANVAAKTRGIIAGVTTNAVAAGSAALSKALIQELIRTMAGNGAQFSNMVIFANAFQIQALSELYGYAPADRTVGGVAVKTLLTDFAEVSVVWAPQMPTDTLLLVDVSACAPVFLPVPDKGYLFYEALSKTGAGESGMFYGQVGLDYGPEEYHGKVTGLATS